MLDPVKIEISPKRVRVLFAGVVIADTFRPRLVWENPHYPAYYLPLADVVPGVLRASERTTTSATRGVARHFDVVVGARVAAAAAWHYPESPVAELRDLVRIQWDVMDSWFEEEEEVFAHPRDPYKRVDVIYASRHVVVAIGDVRIAESRRPTLVLETGLPLRYYLAKTDVRMDLLAPIAKRTVCAYKGVASYWVYQVGDRVVEQDVAWSYAHPLPESAKIAGMLGFYNETLTITVDGVVQDRPITEFSR